MRRPANVDLEACLGRHMAAVHRCKRDSNAQTWRHRATRHMPDVDSTGKDAVAGPRDSPALHLHTHEPRIIVARPLRFDRLATDDGPAPLYDTGAVHLEQRLVPVEILFAEQVTILK